MGTCGEGAGGGTQRFPSKCRMRCFQWSLFQGFFFHFLVGFCLFSVNQGKSSPPRSWELVGGVPSAFSSISLAAVQTHL